MGQQYFCADTTVIDAVAGRFDAAAELIEHTARTVLGALAFDGAAAGRVHAGEGEALRRALDGWVPELVRWARANAEIAAALRAGAASYVAAEAGAADRIG